MSPSVSRWGSEVVTQVSKITLCVILGSTVFFSDGSSFRPIAPRTGLTAAPARAEAKDITQIQHVVFIIKENRTFDNYLGTYPGADGATSGTISTGRVIPLGHTPDQTPHDIDHFTAQALIAIDGGNMDRFDLINGGNNNGDYLAYTQLKQQDIPNYFTYAQNFVLGDRMFSSMHGGSFPNHLYTIAAQANGALGNATDHQSWGCDAAPGTTVQVMDAEGDVSDVFPCFDIQTLADELRSAGLTWKSYSPTSTQAGYIWQAFDYISHIRNSSLWTQNVVPFTQFITDAQTGNLPDLSWVITTTNVSEHPPQSSCAGENTTVRLMR